MKNLARSKLVIRKIRRSDLQKGFLESLDSLRTASNISRGRADAILKKIASNPDHVIFVAEKDGMIVGSTTLIIEQKFIHNGGKVGHIEDVVVAKQMQGLGIGEKIIRSALMYAKSKGCYKTILDCDRKVKPFYEKIGFKAHSYGMRFDH
ncbi:putative glucosamine 6-phosphate N-acetyltransferase [Candidatus Nitrosotenuis uzonensis]|uniref:glucosamine-phosphate N-acetyltransferase n=1 Tax=Candidatus Nitrosotenuis uzonensis TaxID=1407055 RepID=V6AQI5_9ARCH|nr:putative glucosamine 6-phosphate N-acetyltransferase [Candidatus Nitrosotenuis uzonensis]